VFGEDLLLNFWRILKIKFPELKVRIARPTQTVFPMAKKEFVENGVRFAGVDKFLILCKREHF